MENCTFEYLRRTEINKLSLEELSAYYRHLRSFEFDYDKPLESSEIKKKLHVLTRLILKLDRLSSGRQLIIYQDRRKNNTCKGKVYASSHVGRYDIESAMEAIGEQAFFVMGDPEETYRNFEGFFLDKIQGRICMDTGYPISELFEKHAKGIELSEIERDLYEEYKKDRHICEFTAIKRVKNRDNILIFPEGAWNVTPRIMQSLFPGAARIAINGDGVIVPIGVLREKKKYLVNIGEEMDVFGACESDTKDITNELKEKMSALVGEMIFNGELVTRNSLNTPRQNETDFVNDIMSEAENGYTLDIIEKTRFHDPNYPENVFRGIGYKKYPI